MLCGIDKPDYKILGDDIVICQKDLADKYLQVMSQLGVEINATKTHSSENLFEFCKRFFLNSVEISPFPLNALVQYGCNIPNILQVLDGPVADRGFLPLFITSSTEGFWETLVACYVKPLRLRKYLSDRLRTTSWLMPNQPMMVSMSNLLRFAREAAHVELEYSQVFDAYKKATIYLKERELEKLSNAGMKILGSTQSVLSKLLFKPFWARVTKTYREFIPIISSLDSSKELYITARKEFDEANDLYSLMAAYKRNPVLPAPNLKGLTPIRPRLVEASSKCAVRGPFIKQLQLAAKSEHSPG